MTELPAAQQQPSAIPTRIVGHADVAPDQLLANPYNFRRHPGAQLDALRGSIGALGWVKSVIVNRQTGHVLDGHARIEEAMRQHAATVPVTYVDLTPDEEKLALTVLDPITGMATHDGPALLTLLTDVEAADALLRGQVAELLAPLLSQLQHDAGLLDQEQQLAALKMAPVGLVDDATDPRQAQYWVWAKCPDEATQAEALQRFGVNPGKSRELDISRVLGHAGGGHDGGEG